MKTKLILAVAVITLTAGLAVPARAGGVSVSINFGLPVVYARPVVQPCPAPVVVYRPVPVYRPVVYSPPRFVRYHDSRDFHGRHHDGRGWDRDGRGYRPGPFGGRR